MKVVVELKASRFTTSKEVTITDSALDYEVKNGFLKVFDTNQSVYAYNVEDIHKFKLLRNE